MEQRKYPRMVGDFNGDGAVNHTDLDLMAENFSTGINTGTTTAALAELLATVPEPGALVVLLVVGFPLLGYRTPRGL